MASNEDVSQAIGCLSTVFPQFVAKELAALTDQVAAGIQGFTDPLAAIGDLSLDSLIDDVATLSEGDVFDNMGEAAAGLLTQHVRRELEDSLGELSNNFPGVTKRVGTIQQLSGKLVTTGSLMMSLFGDMPYAAAQKMCETILKLTDLKRKNLLCLRQHIAQMTNLILVLLENVNNYVDDTLLDLGAASAQLNGTVKVELARSQVFIGGQVVFDSAAFDRAREGMNEVRRRLTPDKDGTSILDVADILTSGSVEAGQVNRANTALTTLVIPSLIQLINVEIFAVTSQVDVINHLIQSVVAVVDDYGTAANTNLVQEQRARAILDIQNRVNELTSRIDLAIKRSSTTAASGEMLFWASRTKSIIALMDRVRTLSFEEGSTEGEAKAAELDAAFKELVDDLTSIGNSVTIAGIEDTKTLKTRVLGITQGASRLLKDLEEGRATKNRVATLHAQAFVTATAQVNAIDDSIRVATLQEVACKKFLTIDLQVRERYDQLIDSLRQLGLDRAVDLLGTGRFTEFLDSDLESMSYLGVAIKCLNDSLNGVDDAQTRLQIINIRDDLIGRRANQDVAAADSSDQGRSRFVRNLQDDIASIQKNAAVVESIVDELTVIADKIGVNVLEAVSGFTEFLGNLDHLAVGATGRLASSLEEFSDHPNGGVVLCEPV